MRFPLQDANVNSFVDALDLVEPETYLYIPQWMQGMRLYPILSFKNSRACFNFGPPHMPCSFLVERGFRTLQELAKEDVTRNQEIQDDDALKVWNSSAADWLSPDMSDELWP